MQRILAQARKLYHVITGQPIYPTRFRRLSLVDICIHCLVNHPEIPVTSLPLDIQEHLQKRRDDPYYRVSPVYSGERWNSFAQPMLECHRIVTESVDRDQRIDSVIKMLKCIDDNIDLFHYDPGYCDSMREMLIKFSGNEFIGEISQYYLLKWFDYKLEAS